MTYSTTTRTVVVHGSPGPELLEALYTSGLSPLVASADVTVWATGPEAVRQTPSSAAVTPVSWRHRNLGELEGNGSVPHLLFTPEQAAEALGVGRTKLYELLREGSLASVMVGGSRRIRRSDLDRFANTPAD